MPAWPGPQRVAKKTYALRSRRRMSSAVVSTAIGLASLLLVAGITLLLLSKSFREQQSIRHASMENDAVERYQVDEQVGVRGYIATHRDSYFEPYRTASAHLASAFDSLERSARELHLRDGTALVDEMRSIHEQWYLRFAQPSLAQYQTADPFSITGKTLMDRFRQTNDRMRQALSDRSDDSFRQTALEFQRLIALATLVLLVLSVAAAFAARRQRELELSLVRDQEVIQTLQRAFESRTEPLTNTEIGTAYLSAKVQAGVGGDLFEVRNVDDGRGYILVADVSGKGVDAAVDTALVRHTVHALARNQSDPSAIARELNEVYLEGRQIDNGFVVVFLAMFDPAQFVLRYCSAAHSSAFLKRANHVEELAATGPAIGITPSSTFGLKEVRLRKGDMLLVTTDGFSEAKNERREMVTDAGAMRRFEASRADNPQALVDELLAKLRAYTGGGIGDDLAVVAVRFTEPNRAVGELRESAR